MYAKIKSIKLLYSSTQRNLLEGLVPEGEIEDLKNKFSLEEFENSKVINLIKPIG